jgi:HKD family nuclease
MIYQNLYYETLIHPCEEGANRLKIISGYATSTMALQHLEDLRRNKFDVNISLLVGMCPTDGLAISNHKGFQEIVASDNYQGKFTCSYIYKPPSVHSKLYIWYKDKSLYKSFIGSVNYTHNAFYHQRESLAEIHDKNVSDYYRLLEADSIYCNELEVESLIQISNDKNYYRNHINEDKPAGQIQETTSVKHVTVSLLSSRTGEVQNTAGLNWGHRGSKNPNRNRNEAYIQLPSNVYRSDFFPPKPQHFRVVTDDSKQFICVRAEKDDVGQTIHTPLKNSLLGEYFRNRLGLPNGAFVTKADLDRYGRTDVVFYKFDDEEYLMDFSV